MERFIGEHRNLVLSSLWLVVGIMMAGYSLLYQPLKSSVIALAPMTSHLNEQNKKLEEEIATKSVTEKNQKAGISSLPAFLTTMNQLAFDNKVVINKLSPDGEGNLRIHMEINADFYTFLRFAAQLESLDVILDNVEIHPYSYDPKSIGLPIHFISFTIIPQNNAEPLKIEATKELSSKVKKAIEVDNLRNPFQRFAKDPRSKEMEQLVDLTWVYKLGGFGATPDGINYAIIDNLEYRVGAKVGVWAITGMDKAEGRVTLLRETEQGTKMKSVLKFRKKSGSGEASK